MIGHPEHRTNVVRDAAERVLRARPGISRDALAGAVTAELKAARLWDKGAVALRLRLADWLRRAEAKGRVTRRFESGAACYHLVERGDA